MQVNEMAAVTRALLIANIAAFGLQIFAEPLLISVFALWPLNVPPASGVGFAPWQLVTYSFLHGGGMHLLFNMLALYMFGSDVEQVLGQRRYLLYYFGCVITAAVAQLFVSSLANWPPYPTIGASGGVFGLLLAFGLFFPRRTVMLLIPPIPMPAWLFVTLYGVLELVLGVTGTSQGIAHFAHLGGMLGGWLMIRSWGVSSRFR
ncbi:MAG: rhomboid family intramembrane serine protease [Burkholderiales bacterium]